MQRLTCVLAVLLLLGAAAASATVINFEAFPTTANGNSPPVGTTYSSLGITFNPSTQGIAAGMANGDPGNWGVNGTNGPMVLAFGAIMGRSMQITFAHPQNYVSFDVASANGATTGNVLSVTVLSHGSTVSSFTQTLGAVNAWTTVVIPIADVTDVQWSAPQNFVVDNIVYRQNLVNGSFETSLGIAPWYVAAANSSISCCGGDFNGRAGSGSAAVSDGINGSLGGAAAYQCVPLPPQTTFKLAAEAYIPSGQVPAGYGRLTATYYTDDRCFNGYISQDYDVALSTVGAWMPTHLTATTPASANSVLVGLGVFKNSGSGDGLQYIVYWDNVTMAPLRSDFDGNGSEDIVLRNYTTGQDALWMMASGSLTSIVDLPAVPAQYRIAGTADFNGDGHPDILLRNTSTGQNAVWLMNGTSISSIVDLPALADTNWRIDGTGDFNMDGWPDILWRNYSTGQDAVWIMNGTTLEQIVDLPMLTNVNYRFQSTGDFNGDGSPDIVLRNYSTGQNAVWLMRGTSLLSVVDLPALPNTNYRIDALCNFDIDAEPDIVWRNYSTGQNAVWIMNGTSISSIVDLPALANTAYEINGPR